MRYTIRYIIFRGGVEFWWIFRNYSCNYMDLYLVLKTIMNKLRKMEVDLRLVQQLR